MKLRLCRSSNRVNQLDRWKAKHTCVISSVFSGHCSQMSQIRFVADEHDDDVVVGVVAQFFQPALDVLVANQRVTVENHGISYVVCLAMS